MKRVAYICADAGVPVFGNKGCSVHVQEIIRTMRRRGWRVELFAARTGGEPPADLSDLPTRQLPLAGDGDAAQPEKAAQDNNTAMRFLLAHAEPFDLVYERHSLWSYAAMELAHESGAPSILEVNAPLIDEQRRHRELSDDETAVACARRAFRAAGAVATVSSGVADYVHGFGVDRRRVHVIANGVDAERFAPQLQADESLTRRGFTVGFVGTMKPWHGLDTLVTAFEMLRQQCSQARLLLIGDGPYRKELEEWRAGCEPDIRAAVQMVGAVSPADVPGYLAKMDAAVLCPPALSDYYFSPLKLFEYMAAGLPVVASRIGQIDEVIDDGVDGLLVTPGDPRALATALADLADRSSLRSSLGLAARARVLERHTWHAVLDRLATLVDCPWQALCRA